MIRIFYQYIFSYLNYNIYYKNKFIFLLYIKIKIINERILSNEYLSIYLNFYNYNNKLKF
jgi:hypothetical protein